jgi:hypothetical protein
MSGDGELGGHVVVFRPKCPWAAGEARVAPGGAVLVAGVARGDLRGLVNQAFD